MEGNAKLIVLFLLITVPWVILLIVKLNSDKKILKNFKKLEEKYGLLPYNPGSNGSKKLHSVKGTYRTRDIMIGSLINDPASGKKTPPHTVLKVQCSNTDNFIFTVVKRNKHNHSAYGKNSVLIEDNDFDNKYIVTTNDPVRIKSIFDFNTRFKLDQVHKLGFNGVIDLKGNSLLYTEKGFLKDDESLMRFELVLHEFCDIADVMKYN